MLRQCKACGLEAHTEEQLELFKKDKSSKHGRGNTCKECMAKNSASWALANPEKYKKGQRSKEHKKRYNITTEEYKKCMSTSNSCEICGKTEDLVYDHDHTTMKFRGVLCRQHNAAIGLLGDTAEEVLKAYTYLEEKEG